MRSSHPSKPDGFLLLLYFAYFVDANRTTNDICIRNLNSHLTVSFMKNPSLSDLLEAVKSGDVFTTLDAIMTIANSSPHFSAEEREDIAIKVESHLGIEFSWEARAYQENLNNALKGGCQR